MVLKLVKDADNGNKKLKLSKWYNWYAWRPVITVSGNYIWMKKIHRRRVIKKIRSPSAGPGQFEIVYEYADIFELLSENKI